MCTLIIIVVSIVIVSLLGFWLIQYFKKHPHSILDYLIAVAPTDNWFLDPYSHMRVLWDIHTYGRYGQLSDSLRNNTVWKPLNITKTWIGKKVFDPLYGTGTITDVTKGVNCVHVSFELLPDVDFIYTRKGEYIENQKSGLYMFTNTDFFDCIRYGLITLPFTIKESYIKHNPNYL